MVASIEKYESHPGRSLVTHIKNVRENAKLLTDLSIAEIAAIMHDIGKINPNFQKKLNGKSNGYSSHAYLSAFIFYLAYLVNKKYFDQKYGLGSSEEIKSIIAIIAHHHGNIPNFSHILNENECDKLFDFLDLNPNIPFCCLLNEFLHVNDFKIYINNEGIRYNFKNVGFESKYPLKAFLNAQFAFASLIKADKKDASEYKRSHAAANKFFNSYSSKLELYIKRFKLDSELNILRSKMRLEAVKNLEKELEKNNRIFSLTAPTGSGKTVMMLSLADVIIQQKMNIKRIIYALPFLSIIEQVEKNCYEIFDNSKNAIIRIDSKAENIAYQNIQEKLEYSPELVDELISRHYAEDFFDFPFIITTFVRLFETLLSNKNSTLLKLPNFSNSIFLIDEIQALPPRLYGFFIALIDAFCKIFNSYAVISTATMPEFRLPVEHYPELKNIFKNYSAPKPILDLKHFYERPFNRYNVSFIKNPLNISDLSEIINREQRSALIILNTIQDTYDLFDSLNQIKTDYEVNLLNTRFMPEDRTNKILNIRDNLKTGHRVVLITTQLIEAGVDIDFPVVYRDLCPLPNIIQSAGRCNRNNKNKFKGKVVIFSLLKNNIERSTLIYRGKDKLLLDYARKLTNKNEIEELALLNKQIDYFKNINDNTIFGIHYSGNDELDLVDKLKNLEFEELGKFKLIDERIHGKEYKYYIPSDSDDSNFEDLIKFVNELKKTKYFEFNQKQFLKIIIEQKLRIMSNRIVQVRIGKYDIPPNIEAGPIYGIYKLNNSHYCEKKGIKLSTENQII